MGVGRPLYRRAGASLAARCAFSPARALGWEHSLGKRAGQRQCQVPQGRVPSPCGPGCLPGAAGLAEDRRLDAGRAWYFVPNGSLVRLCCLVSLDGVIELSHQITAVTSHRAER